VAMKWSCLSGKIRLILSHRRCNITAVECAVIGGWPAHHRLTTKQSILAVRDYLAEITRVDINRVDQRRRDPAKVKRVMQSLARNVATPVALRALAVDAGGAGGALEDETVRGYLDALAQLMIIEDQPSWAPHLRSKSTLRSASKRHFVDPSLAVAALRATPERLLKDLNFRHLTHLGKMPEFITCAFSFPQTFFKRLQSHIRSDFIAVFKTIGNGFCRVIDPHWNPFDNLLLHTQVHSLA